MSEPRTLRIIEPSLRSNAGHYAEFVRCVAHSAAPTFTSIEVDAAVGSDALPILCHPSITVRQMFGGAHRQSERAALWESQLRSDSPTLVLTAKASHALLLAVGGLRAGACLDTLRLYFHWRETALWQRALVAVSPTVRRGVLAITPTRETAEFLRRSGWRRVAHVAYPASAPTTPHAPSAQPTRLLVAGAARVNKGIALVASFAAARARGGTTLPPLLVQSTGKRRGRHGHGERGPMRRLASLPSDGLTLDPSAPDHPEYIARFDGALVLAPYDPVKFADNVSGIALDALLHGAPVIATRGTWQARVIERFGAGVVMDAWSAESLDRAVDHAILHWPTISEGAQRAARALAQEHDPAHLVRALAL